MESATGPSFRPAPSHNWAECEALLRCGSFLIPIRRKQWTEWASIVHSDLFGRMRRMDCFFTDSLKSEPVSFAQGLLQSRLSVLPERTRQLQHQFPLVRQAVDPFAVRSQPRANPPLFSQCGKAPGERFNRDRILTRKFTLCDFTGVVDDGQNRELTCLDSCRS